MGLRESPVGLLNCFGNNINHPPTSEQVPSPEAAQVGVFLGYPDSEAALSNFRDLSPAPRSSMTGLPIAQGVSCGIARGPCMVSQQCLSELGRTQGPRSLFPQQSFSSHNQEASELTRPGTTRRQCQTLEPHKGEERSCPWVLNSK